MLVIDSWESRGIVLAMSDGMFCAGMCWHHLGGVSSPLATRMVCCWCGQQADSNFVYSDPDAKTPASQNFHGHYAQNVPRGTIDPNEWFLQEPIKPIRWSSIESLPQPPPEPARCRHGKTGPCWDDPPLSIGVNQ